MAENEVHTEHVEKTATGDGDGMTEHTTIEQDGEKLVDETKHDPDDVDDSANAGRDS